MKSIYFQKFKIFDILFRPTENKKSEFLTKRQKIQTKLKNTNNHASFIFSFFRKIKNEPTRCRLIRKENYFTHFEDGSLQQG